jgi:hypothetical protein
MEHHTFRTVLLLLPIIEYIAAHELVHLYEPHHRPAFWQRLKRGLPDDVTRKY